MRRGYACACVPLSPPAGPRRCVLHWLVEIETRNVRLVEMHSGWRLCEQWGERAIGKWWRQHRGPNKDTVDAAAAGGRAEMQEVAVGEA